MQYDALFRTGAGIYAVPLDFAPVFFVVVGCAPVKAMNIHRQIVGDTKHPCAQVVLHASRKAKTDQSKKRLLNHILGLVRIEAERTKIRMQRGPEVIVELNDPLASRSAV